MVELVMALEDEFETEIPDEEAEKITTVQQAIDYINSRTASSKLSLYLSGGPKRLFGTGRNRGGFRKMPRGSHAGRCRSLARSRAAPRAAHPENRLSFLLFESHP